MGTRKAKPDKPVALPAPRMANQYWDLRAKEMAARTVYALVLQSIQQHGLWEKLEEYRLKGRSRLQDMEIAHAVVDAAMITKAGRELMCLKELQRYSLAIHLLADIAKEGLDICTKAGASSTSKE